MGSQDSTTFPVRIIENTIEKCPGWAGTGLRLRYGRASAVPRSTMGRRHIRGQRSGPWSSLGERGRALESWPRLLSADQPRTRPSTSRSQLVYGSVACSRFVRWCAGKTQPSHTIRLFMKRSTAPMSFAIRAACLADGVTVPPIGCQFWLLTEPLPLTVGSSHFIGAFWAELMCAPTI